VKRKRGKRRERADDDERCQVDAAKLRALRLDAELTVRRLAWEAEIDPKSVTELEAGRRAWSTRRVVRSIAAHPEINVDWRELLVKRPRDLDDASRATSLPPRSSLDEYVSEERRIGKLPPLTTAHGPVPSFGAADLANAFSSPGSQAGARFYARGRIHAHRGLGVTDGLVLGIRYRDGARFEVVRAIGTVEKPLSVMVITTTVEHTRRLQKAWEAGREVMAIVRVVVADFVAGDDEHVHITNLDGGAEHLRPRRVGAELWRGFTPIYAKGEGEAERAPRAHPWGLVVESIAVPEK